LNSHNHIEEKGILHSPILHIAAALGAAAIFLLLAYSIRDILLMFFAAFIFAIAFDGLVERLSAKMPRSAAAILIYILILSVFGGLLYLVLPPLANELINFSSNYSFYVDRFLGKDSVVFYQQSALNFPQNISEVSETIAASSKTIIGTLFTVFGGVMSFFVIVFVAMLLNMQKDGVRRFVLLFASAAHRDYALYFFEKVRRSMGGWLWGKTISSIIVGLLTMIGLLILGVPYALTLGVLSALFNYVVFVGPIIASIPAILLALAISPMHAIIVAVMYFFINGIIENFLIVPLLMKRAADLNPVLLIFFAIAGGQLGGALGVIVSIPLAMIVSLITDEYLKIKGEQPAEPSIV